MRRLEGFVHGSQSDPSNRSRPRKSPWGSIDLKSIGYFKFCDLVMVFLCFVFVFVNVYLCSECPPWWMDVRLYDFDVTLHVLRILFDEIL